MVTVPLFAGFVRLPQHLAHGTSLLVVLFAAAAFVASEVGTDWLRRAFGVVAVVAASQMAFTTLREN